jgi:hypothetical protein
VGVDGAGRGEVVLAVRHELPVGVGDPLVEVLVAVLGGVLDGARCPDLGDLGAAFGVRGEVPDADVAVDKLFGHAGTVEPVP